jgi:hypothetical protein
MEHINTLPLRRECLKTRRSPFDKPVLSTVEGLRANGSGIEIVADFPFVLSLSKHEEPFLSSLYKRKEKANMTMAELIAQGTWVEIHRIVLPAGERAPQTPPDTQRVPLEMRVKGFLAAPAVHGEEAEIVTPAGRCLRGTLVEVNPAYTHGFGAPIPELSAIGGEVRAILRGRGRIR